ncbi:MAG: hypothetical protein MJE68_18650, partial [Proteobacteria bacterium]|nr:hypothetical protein [Pseudomonadota bacterium]
MLQAKKPKKRGGLSQAPLFPRDTSLRSVANTKPLVREALKFSAVANKGIASIAITSLRLNPSSKPAKIIRTAIHSIAHTASRTRHIRHSQPTLQHR